VPQLLLLLSPWASLLKWPLHLLLPPPRLLLRVRPLLLRCR
jgi:hypothetical protein